MTSTWPLTGGDNADSLAEYVGLSEVTGFVRDCWEDAYTLVEGWLESTCGPRWEAADAMRLYPHVPADVAGRAVLEVGAELYHRKNTKNGISQFASPDGSAVRVARDPLTPAYPILRPFIGGGFA